jgi:ligand-binding sensor domain-containing protein
MVKHKSFMKTIFTITLIVFLSCSFCEIGKAQNKIDLCTQWRDFTKATEVTSLAQDGKYIWIGTKGGLIKFDTSTKEHELFLKTNSGLPVNWITTLLRDKDGAIWIGTWAGGLAKYDNGNWTQFNTHNQAFPDSIIVCLSEDSSSNIWIGTQNGLVEYSQGQFLVLSLPLPSYSFIHALATDATGNVWVSLVNVYTTYSALGKYDGANWTTFTSQNSSILDQYVYAIGCTKNKIWIGFELGDIQSFDGSTFTKSTSLLSGAGILSLIVDPNENVYAGNGFGTIKFSQNGWQYVLGGIANAILPLKSLWVGSNNGLVKAEGGVWSDFSNSTLPTNEMEAALTVDQKGNMWSATFAGSYKESDKIPVFDGKNFSTITPPVTPSAQTRPISLCADSNGNVWVGMIDTGIYRFDGTNWTNFSQSNSALRSNRPKCMAYDKKSNKLWAGFYLNGGVFGGSAGCAVFDGTSWKAYTGKDMGYPGYAEINQIAVDKDGNVWAGAAYQGLSRFDGNSWQLFTTANSGLPDNFITGVACQRSGAVWIATAGGLAKYDNGTWTAYSTSNSPLPWKEVTAVAVDKEDRVWIGTFGHGAARYDKGKWTIYGQENSGITNYNIKSIVPDAYGNVWFAMEYAGIAEYSPTGFHDPYTPLFALDTVKNCDDPGIDSVLVFGQDCKNRKIISQYIEGKDSSYYRIIHNAVNPVYQDSILVEFLPDTERSYNAFLSILLEDSTNFLIPLSGYGKGRSEIQFLSAGIYNDTIGAEVKIPIILTHNNLLTSAEMIIHYDTSMLVYEGCKLPNGDNMSHEEDWTGRSKLFFESKDFGNNDTIAFARFLIFPVKDPCADVVIDSLIISPNNNNCSVLANNSLTVHVCSSIGCGTNILSNFLRYNTFPNISVSPNPSVNSITILSSMNMPDIKIELYNVLGQSQLMLETSLKASIPLKIDINKIRVGVYFVRITENGSVSARQIIKK